MAGRLSKPEYVVAPDGLPARVVGRWVDRKVRYVDHEANIFATGMHKIWARRGYIELFAGPGCSYNKATREFIAGSAIRALDFDLIPYGVPSGVRRVSGGAGGSS